MIYSGLKQVFYFVYIYFHNGSLKGRLKEAFIIQEETQTYRNGIFVSDFFPDQAYGYWGNETCQTAVETVALPYLLCYLACNTIMFT